MAPAVARSSARSCAVPFRRDPRVVHRREVGGVQRELVAGARLVLLALLQRGGEFLGPPQCLAQGRVAAARSASVRPKPSVSWAIGAGIGGVASGTLFEGRRNMAGDGEGGGERAFSARAASSAVSASFCRRAASANSRCVSASSARDAASVCDSASLSRAAASSAFSAATARAASSASSSCRTRNSAAIRARSSASAARSARAAVRACESDSLSQATSPSARSGGVGAAGEFDELLLPRLQFRFDPRALLGQRAAFSERGGEGLRERLFCRKRPRRAPVRRRRPAGEFDELLLPRLQFRFDPRALVAQCVAFGNRAGESLRERFLVPPELAERFFGLAARARRVRPWRRRFRPAFRCDDRARDRVRSPLQGPRPADLRGPDLVIDEQAAEHLARWLEQGANLVERLKRGVGRRMARQFHQRLVGGKRPFVHVGMGGEGDVTVRVMDEIAGPVSRFVVRSLAVGLSFRRTFAILTAVRPRLIRPSGNES